MYERTYGYRYERNRPVKDDAKMIRADIKTLSKAGMLPADWKYSVRYRSFAGGCSIDISARSPRPIYTEDPSRLDVAIRGSRDETLTKEARAVEDALTELHRAYNHDGSETQVDYWDVKFYGVPSIGCLEGVEKWPGGERAGAYGF